jgi:hypothetical protein
MKGKKTGGRKKGTPNKVTTETRNLFSKMFERLAPDVEKWIRATAEGREVPIVTEDGELLRDAKGKVLTKTVGQDPARAAELTQRLAEFCIPKLARTEHADSNGAPLEGLTLIIEKKTDGSGQP